MEHSFFSSGINYTYRLLKWEQLKGSNDFILNFEVTKWPRFFGKKKISNLTVRGLTTWYTWPDGVHIDERVEEFITTNFQQRILWDLEEIIAKELDNTSGFVRQKGRFKIYDPELLMLEKLKDSSNLNVSK